MLVAMPTVLRAQDNDGSTDPKRVNNATEQRRISDYGLHLTAGLDLLYDDNVYRVDDRVENPTDDLIVTPSLEATFGLSVGPNDNLLRCTIGDDRFVSAGQASRVLIATEQKAKGVYRAATLSSTDRKAK